MDVKTVLDREEQRQFQAEAWGLDPKATWPEIREYVRKRACGSIFVDPDDWYETMIDLYGSEIFDT